jgi:murein DD-endopeptidase MepM/ murein hydrolase activator NlpD
LSVLNPLSRLGDNPKAGRSRGLLLGLLVGLLLGTLAGYGLALLAGPGGTAVVAAGAASLDGSIDAPSVAQASPAAPTPTSVDGDSGAQPAGGDPASGSGSPAMLPGPDGGPLESLQRIDLTISGSLYSTLAAQLENRQADILNAQLGRILTWWLDLRREVLPGDRIQALYAPESGPGEIRLLAIRYSSEKRNEVHEAFYFKPSGARYGHYYDEQGQEIEQRLVNGPIKDYEQITELMSNTGRRHKGVDFKTDIGTPVRIPYKARVNRLNWHPRGNGNCLELTFLPSGITALFLHLDQVLPEVRPGMVLEAGAEVARTGNTGRSTAPHLHYELHGPGGNLLSPFKVHPTEVRKLEGEDLKALEKQRASLLPRLQGDGSKP